MKLLRQLSAFVYGFSLTYCVCIWFAGFMAARGVPREYFQYFAQFGTAGKEVGVALLYVPIHLVPTVALLVIGALGPALLSSKHRKQIGTSIILGAFVSYVFWTIFYALASSGDSVASLKQYFRAITAQWWALPAMVAPLLGLLLASRMLTKLSTRAAEA